MAGTEDGPSGLTGAGDRLRASSTVDGTLLQLASEAGTLTSRLAWAARVDARGAIVGGWHGASSGAPSDTSLGSLTSSTSHAASPIVDAAGVTIAVLALGGSTEAPKEIASLVWIAGLVLDAALLREQNARNLRAREILLGSVSHDLRNPLNTFAMSAGLLRDDVERDDLVATRIGGLVTRMDRAGARMQSILRELQQASAFDGGNVELARDAVRASDLLEAAAGAKHDAEKIATLTIGDVEDADLDIDRAKAIEAFTKLRAFATKATGDSGSIHVDGARDAALFRFVVRALGPDGRPVTTPEEGRGGLPLLVARAIIEAHGGALVVPTRDPGSKAPEPLTMTFTLPAAS